ncbi:mitochondrial E3 ubiquitin protein ligase 1-like [Aphis gossypii]|uniref:mitochondrial E3 ubiquitin protein ligase 1-like n=1 Tax=Aphis gossypii TaxID=80765 RepID=UPI002158DBAA|nr:mitochondrial E3 ubiquitin protein ligase 1-like [Aphis gossypii]
MSLLPLYETQYFGQEPIGTENDGDMPIVYVGRQNEEEPVRIENDENISINVHFRRPNEEVENMREIIVCIACLNEESNVVLRPCNHTCLCGAYYEGLSRLVCPLCRETIREIVVFLS